MLPVAIAAVQALTLGMLAVQQRRTLVHFDEDLAIYDQVVWNTAHGRPFASTLIEHAANLLGDHFAPAVAVFAPLYWLIPSASVLLLGQALALALAGPPLHAFARDRLGPTGAALVAVAYALYPAVHHVALFQFHEIALIVAPLMLALLALERGRRGLFLAAALGSLAVKEEAAIVVAALAPLWWLRRRDVPMAVATAGLGIAVGYLAMGVILPSLNTADAGERYYYYRRYDHLGSTPLEVAVNAVAHPERWATVDRLRFVLQLGSPLLFAPLVGWEYVVASLPIFGYLLLANSPDHYSIDRHYLSPLVPLLMFGAVVGCERLGHLAGRALPPRPPRPPGGRLASDAGPCAVAAGPERPCQPCQAGASALAGMLALACLASAYLLRPAPALVETAHTRDLRRMIAQVPPESPVSASRNLLSPFSRRERVYRFPVLGDAEYVLLDFRELRHPSAFGVDDGAFGRLVESPAYRMIDSAAGAALFRRGDPSTAPPGLGPPRASFGDAIELLGSRAARDGEDVDLLLAWVARRRVARPYTVFVHAFDAAGERVAQADAPPLDGLMPTDTWAPDHVVVDRHRVAGARGVVRLQVGLYDGATGRRLAPDLVEVPVR